MPLTPAVLSKLPLGLLGFFGIKNGGQYPQSIVPTLAPTLDLLQMLAANYNEKIAGGTPGGISASGFIQAINVVDSTNIIVPNSELWYLSHYSVFANCTAGETCSFCGQVNSTQSGGASDFHMPLTRMVAAVASNQDAAVSDGAIRSPWFGPGDRFGWLVRNFAGTPDLACSLMLTRFPF